MPQVGIKPMSPCILVRSANHYTIGDHHADSIAVSWLVKLVEDSWAQFFWNANAASYYWSVFQLWHKAQIHWIIPNVKHVWNNNKQLSVNYISI